MPTLDPSLIAQYQAVYNQFAGHRDQLDVSATNTHLLGVYCINCGVAGQSGISGPIAASLANGLTQARFGVGGANIVALANIGIQAYAQKELEKSFNLLRHPVGAWVIPGVVSFGPLLAQLGWQDKRVGVRSTPSWSELHVEQRSDSAGLP